ncbi:rod-binding protein [Azospirillum sp.]|uniref:rod-binding protein n=1 Tax=Azospirillum sp. TaxID=34012 RepID=UPI003D758C7A
MDAALQTPALPAPRFNPLVERAAHKAYGAPAGGQGSGKVDPAVDSKLRKAANEFETQFLSQMLAPMFETVETDPMFGGGHGEDMFRSLLVNEYGKQMSSRGGIGIADSVYRELLRAQEANSHG